LGQAVRTQLVDVLLADTLPTRCEIFACVILILSRSILTVEAQWTSRPKDASVDVNTSLTWKCRAEGVPPIKYTWLHNGMKMKKSADPDYFIINEGTLRFSRIQVNQKGMYQCHASNSVKELITAAELDVKGMCICCHFPFLLYMFVNGWMS
jgi:hypothetical protein